MYDKVNYTSYKEDTEQHKCVIYCIFAFLCLQVTGRSSGTVIPPPLVRGGQHVPSKHNSQIVMPPLVRGAQVSVRGNDTVEMKFLITLAHILKCSHLKKLRYKELFFNFFLCLACSLHESVIAASACVLLSAYCNDSPADSQSTSATAAAQRFRPPSTLTGSPGFCAQCPGPGPEDHSAGTHSGG